MLRIEKIIYYNAYKHNIHSNTIVVIATWLNLEKQIDCL